MNLTLVRRQPETHDTESFFWQPETAFEFKPGQFLKWTLPHANPDDRGINHFFSISASPTEELIRLTTKFNAERSSSFKVALKALQPGQTIEVGPPSGGFVLPDDHDQPVVLVAGGIGVTPYRSMLKWLVDTSTNQPVELIYGARSDQDFAFRSEFDDWASGHDFKIQYLTGPINGPAVMELADINAKLVYLSGPEPMVEALKTELLNLNLNEDNIKTDYFPGYSVI